MTATWTRYTMHDNIIYGPVWCLQLLAHFSAALWNVWCAMPVPPSPSTSSPAWTRTHQQIVHLNTNCGIKDAEASAKVSDLTWNYLCSHETLTRVFSAALLAVRLSVLPNKFIAWGAEIPDWQAKFKDCFFRLIISFHIYFCIFNFLLFSFP